MIIRPVGILGGTFDPVHLGHLGAADAARLQLDLAQVLFIPNHIPPHKPERSVAPERDRLAMLELALAGQSAFGIDRLELERAGPSYTFDTIDALRRQHADWQIHFIVGSDAFLDLHTWHRWDELLRLCAFAVVSRPGYDRRRVARMLQELDPGLQVQVSYLEVPTVDVSSSQIREAIAAGESLAGLVPPAVAAYIQTRGLYRPGT